MSNIPLVCDHCGKAFFDYHGSNWCDCGAKWCSETCAELDGYKKVDFRSSCNYCRGNDFEDSELLEFVVSALGVSREDLVSHYKNYKNELSNGNTCTLDGYIRLKSFNTEANIALVEAVLGHMSTKKGDIYE